MDKLKLTDVVPRFNGDNNDDVELWIDKINVAVKIYGSKEEIGKLIPLFLNGSAYITWKQMDEEKQNNLDEIFQSLRKVYGMTKAAAWSQLKQLKFIHGDSIDVLAEHCAKLLNVVSGGEKVPEQLVSVTLLDALPDQVTQHIRMQHGESMRRAKIVEAAKSMLASAANEPFLLFADSKQHNSVTSFSGNCFGCGQKGHRKDKCRTKCQFCSRIGHTEKYCYRKKSENEQVEGVSSQNQTLSTQNQ